MFTYKHPRLLKIKKKVLSSKLCEIDLLINEMKLNLLQLKKKKNQAFLLLDGWLLLSYHGSSSFNTARKKGKGVPWICDLTFLHFFSFKCSSKKHVQ